MDPTSPEPMRPALLLLIFLELTVYLPISPLWRLRFICLSVPSVWGNAHHRVDSLIDFSGNTHTWSIDIIITMIMITIPRFRGKMILFLDRSSHSFLVGSPTFLGLEPTFFWNQWSSPETNADWVVWPDKCERQIVLGLAGVGHWAKCFNAAL